MEKDFKQHSSNKVMMSDYVISSPNYSWKCELAPNVFWNVEEGKQPNAFHRLMQELCFGFKWSKIDD